MKRRIAFRVLKLAIAVAAIVWLVAGGKIDFRQLSGVGQRRPWLVLAQVPFAGVLLVTAVRWRLLLRAQGIQYAFGDTYSLTMIGWMFNQVIPGSVGGDMVKAYIVAREQPGRRGAAVISVLVDRALGLFVLVAVALAAVLVNVSTVAGNDYLTFLAWSTFALFAGSVAAACVFFSSKVRSLPSLKKLLARLPFQRLLRRLNEAAYAYKYRPREVAWSLLLSMGIQVGVVLMNICLARALIDGPLHWQGFFFLVPIAHLLMAVPINPPAAVGTAEALYGELFRLLGITQGALICILQRATFCLWAVLGFYFYLRRKGGVRGAMEEARRAGEDDQGSDTAAGEEAFSGRQEPAARRTVAEGAGP